MKLCVRKGRKCSKNFLELKILILSNIREGGEKYLKKLSNNLEDSKIVTNFALAIGNEEILKNLKID